ncbi:PREDICTED: uncharacterized protein LOC107164361 [Diuraphis noxia]|uniref:uncharacterized protein LOC107164361 n=1 Tax=Diuraphis noxia TaxID=143948 RepID=UPI000763A832|nr:PREDICTED: uncharacterized protein LOC107164361 [Diuraphis noxia]
MESPAIRCRIQFNKIMSSTNKQQKIPHSYIIKVRTAVQRLRKHKCDNLNLKRLAVYAQKRILIILENVISSAMTGNKKKVSINDLESAFQKANFNTRIRLITKKQAITTTKASTGSIPKARSSTIPRSSPHNNAVQDVNMIETPGYELTNDVLSHIIQTQFNQKIDDVLPKLDDLDIEEVIEHLQNNHDKQDNLENKDVTTYKFNVDSLLNDPYTL